MTIPDPRPTRWVDPRDLITRANVRTIAEPDPQLVDSIRTHGVLQPPLVYDDAGQLVLVAGHRRTAAAIAADLDRIEVVVGPQPQDGERIAAQVSENSNRVGLVAAEVVDAVEQMTLLGMPAGQIAKAAGLRTRQVEAARAVAAADQRVRDAVRETPDLTLDQAAALTEYGTDPDAVADLISAAETGPVAFAHAQARLESERDTRDRLAQATREWTDRGYTVLEPDRSGYDHLPKGAAYVRDLADEHGTRLGSGYYGTTDQHEACPSRAILLNKWRPESVQEVCLDPKANGHTRAPSGYAATAPQPGPERSLVMANNKLWTTASTVRHDHLTALIKAGRFPATLVTAVHRHLLAHPHHLQPHRGALYSRLTDFPASGATTTESAQGLITRTIDATAPANRLTGLLLAAVADAAERSVSESTWRRASTPAADWLILLVDHAGYQLAPIEQTAVALTHPTWTPTTTTPPRGPGRRAAAVRGAAPGSAAGRAAAR